MTERRSNESREGSFKNWMFQWFIVVLFAAIEAVLLIKMVSSDSPSSALLFAIVLIAGLLLLTGAQSFGIATISLGTRGLEAKLQEVEHKVEVANNRILELFVLTLSRGTYLELSRLARPEGLGPYMMTPALSRELERLANIGYIEVPSFDAIPTEGENLSDYVTITDEGREFLRLRQQLED
jgi:hypothetical protein